MIRKKNSFFTFCFSLLPGAGQMYMGFMKRGVSLMSSFFLLIFLAIWLSLEPIMLIMPIIWFYAFFDTHNLRSTPDDEFYTLEDNFILIPDFAMEKAHLLQSKYRNILAIALIVIGGTILWDNLLDIISWVMPHFIRDYIRDFGRILPQLIIGAAIIALGIYLIRGKKKDLDNSEMVQALEDKGGNQ
jgi:TM2 domain-containing membrane protein YozV